MSSPGAWQSLRRAVPLIVANPRLGGIVLRMRPGPVWDAALVELRAAFPDLRRWPASLALSDLSGGLDSTATLAAGKAVYTKGLLQRAQPLLVPSAERLDRTAAALIGQAMDAGTAPPLFLIDEGADAQEGVNAALADRCAFHCDLTDVTLRDLHEGLPTPSDGTPAEDAAALLTALAVRLGVPGLRAPVLALQTAQTLAPQITMGAVTQAAELVLAPRATQLPEDAQDDAPPPPESDQSDDTQDPQSAGDTLPEEILVEAIRAHLPEDLLTRSTRTPAKAGRGFAGKGQKRRGNRRGRPLPAVHGQLDGQVRLDLTATLRAAVPWQTLRRRQVPTRTGVILAPRDIHVQRMEERSDRVLVFAVDASGSSALARLGEVKGAVELVLARAYAQRDHVALVAFRKDGADVLLPATRSLTQAKKHLAALPGGGGTPLAAGIDAGLREALSARARGLTPQMVLLTDGRGNIALDGSANRAQAQADAEALARHIAACDVEALVIDTGRRPHSQLAEIAATMRADYVPLPRAQAAQISDVVTGTR
ncbi:VWA domain-containing protein [Pseudaestuariivita sp.]|uniref:VWA domain-containing protein n=1 Tax=Pseudaestuariivita sp. TaxID=2211669 RepID=UPI0040587587